MQLAQLTDEVQFFEALRTPCTANLNCVMSVREIIWIVGSLFANCLLVANGSICAEIDRFVDLHSTTVDSIWSVHAKFKVKAFNRLFPDTTDEYEVEYFSQGDDERWITRRNREEHIGEFTGIQYKLGIRDVSNGTAGFREINNYDGTLDPESGQVPIDSKASVVFASRSHGKLVFLSRLYLGLQVFVSNSSIPLTVRSIAKRPTKSTFEIDSTSKLVKLNFQVDEGALDVMLEPKFGYAIQKARFVAERGFQFEIVYSDFHEQGKEVYLPNRFHSIVSDASGQEVKGRLETEGSIEYFVINEKIPVDKLLPPLPQGIPYHDRLKNEAGVWGDDKPALVFDSNEEARNWDANRKKAYVRLHNKNFSAASSIYLIVSVLIIVVASMVVARKVILSRQSRT